MNMRSTLCGLAVVLSLFAAVGVAQTRSTKLSSARSAACGGQVRYPLSAAWVFLKNVRTNFRPQQLHR